MWAVSTGVLSGEGSGLNGKSSLCELIIMQKSSPLKGTLFSFVRFIILGGLNCYA